MSVPKLPTDHRDQFVVELIAVRGKVVTTRRAADERGEAIFLEAVDRAKRALRHRGTIWRGDGAPDLSRNLYRDLEVALCTVGRPTRRR